MSSDIWTWSEIEAARVCAAAGYLEAGGTSNQGPDFHACGNRIIRLAEQIKAKRAVVAMQEKGELHGA